MKFQHLFFYFLLFPFSLSHLEDNNDNPTSLSDIRKDLLHPPEVEGSKDEQSQ